MIGNTSYCRQTKVNQIGNTPLKNDKIANKLRKGKNDWRDPNLSKKCLGTDNVPMNSKKKIDIAKYWISISLEKVFTNKIPLNILAHDSWKDILDLIGWQWILRGTEEGKKSIFWSFIHASSPRIKQLIFKSIAPSRRTVERSLRTRSAATCPRVRYLIVRWNYPA